MKVFALQFRVQPKTGVMHTKCTRLKGSITIRKEASSRQGAVVFVSNKFIASTPTIWSSGSSRA